VHVIKGLYSFLLVKSQRSRVLLWAEWLCSPVIELVKSGSVRESVHSRCYLSISLSTAEWGRQPLAYSLKCTTPDLACCCIEA